MSGPEPTTPQHRRVALFVGAHVAAVSAVYVLAAWIGGGLAAAPFPPDEQPLAAATMPAAAPPTATTPTAQAAVAVPLVQVKMAHDVAPPWSVDASGRVQVREP